eukprot:gnl/TRDRNA2_/TRDRNA2_195628_c0_seq1.p1 gnl/TRDRNA2_/TRDRNA2_195628_c0~~gnl/TRDRNA2_/TRDRNA2_195628_c0_seq1.p1  ORF type:complete len:170 (+),score=42.11 gnl/TRDRNA2_/TRDRNA2_195628_c0_seq1:112-621(+)
MSPFPQTQTIEVPDWLLGPAATFVAVALLYAMIITALSLALVQMKTHRFMLIFRRGERSTRVAHDGKDLECCEEAPKKRKKKMGRRAKSSNQLIQIFFEEDNFDDEDEGNEPFELDDEAWLSPFHRRKEHFIGGETPAQSDAEDDGEPTKKKLEAYELDDKVWCSLAPS